MIPACHPLTTGGADRSRLGIGSRQCGVGLVELMLVCVISALLVAVGMRLYHNMREEQNAVAQVRHVTQIITRLQSLYGGPTGYAFLSSDQCAMTAMVVPSELWSPDDDCTGGKKAFNLSDGDIAFIAPPGQPDYILLVWNHVPTSQCMPLVVGTEALAAAVEISGVPRSGALQPNPKFVKELGQKLDVASLAQWCSTEELDDPGPVAPFTQSTSWVQIRYWVGR